MTVKRLSMILYIIINVILFAKDYSEITVVSDDNYPPYIFIDENKNLKGIIVDQWKLWEKKTGIKVKIVAMNWSAAQRFMNEEKADVIDTIFINEERKLIYDFTKPYAKIDVPIFYNSNISGIGTIEDLKGFNVAVKDGDACIDILRGSNINSLDKYKSYEEIIKLAEKNEVKIFCVDLPPAYYYLYKLNIEQKFKIGPIISVGEFHRAVKKGNSDLLEKIELGFDAFSKDEIKNIEEKWLGRNLDNKGLYKVFYITSIFTVIILFFLILTYILGRLVKSKTLELTKALKDIKEVEQRNRAVLNAMPDIVFVQKKDGNYVDYFAKQEHDLFVEPDKIIGYNMFEMPFSKEFLDNARSTVEKVLLNDSVEIFEYELEIKTEKKHFEARIAKYGVDEVVWICRDITEKKNGERKILNAMQKAEEANDAKSQFLANMSHEIRTPLNGIMGMMQLLKITELSTDQLEYINIMEFSSEALLAIINDILDISKIESGKVDVTDDEFSIYELTENISSFISAAAEEKGIEMIYYVEKSVPEFIISDAGKIKQILINILNNAVKFTDVGEIKFNIMKHKEKEEFVWIRFEIKDTGIGIEKGKMDKLFQKFYQVDYSSTKRYGGTGLGLAISKEMAKILGGDIDVESHYGNGTCFYLTLKFKKGRKKHYTEYQSLNGRSYVIMAADNNNSSLETLVKIFASENIDIMTVDNAPEIVAIAEKRIVDFFILDYDLHGLEDILKQLLDKKIVEPKKVILLSPLDKNKVKRIAEMFGITKIVKKPIKRSELFKEMNFERKTDKTNEKVIKHGIIREEIKVMVIEDNEVNQMTLGSLLEILKCSYTICGNGEDGIEKLKHYKHDIVLMDIGLPGIDGFEAIKKIRMLDEYKKIPIIVVTAYTTEEDRQKSISAGANDFLPKPYKVEDLKNKMDKYLGVNDEFADIV